MKIKYARLKPLVTEAYGRNHQSPEDSTQPIGHYDHLVSYSSKSSRGRLIISKNRRPDINLKLKKVANNSKAI